MPKVGRNDPCPCGSGRKHKQCCLADTAGPADLLWHRLRQVIEPLVADLLTFSRGEYGDTLLEEAWDEFTLGKGPAPFSSETVHMPVFIPWFLYDWHPDPVATAGPAHLLDEFPVAAAFSAGHAASTRSWPSTCRPASSGPSASWRSSRPRRAPGSGSAMS